MTNLHPTRMNINKNHNLVFKQSTPFAPVDLPRQGFEGHTCVLGVRGYQWEYFSASKEKQPSPAGLAQSAISL